MQIEEVKVTRLDYNNQMRKLMKTTKYILSLIFIETLLCYRKYAVNPHTYYNK